MARPRVFSFPPEEMEKLGQEMVDWVIENQPIHLSQWYTLHKGYTYNEWKNFIDKSEFLPYYEQALKTIGLKYLLKDSPIEPSLKQRWQRVYFKDVKEEEDETAKFNATLTQDKPESKEISDKIDGFLSALDRYQSDRKSSDIKSNADAKP